MNPILIEVITPMFSNLELGCRGCRTILSHPGLKGQARKTSMDEYPAEWRENIDLLAGWIREILDRYPNRVNLQLIDAQSPVGLWKQIRHWIFTYPAWIIGHRAASAGWDRRELETLIETGIGSMGENATGRHPT
jgi:hypothetical protein